MIQATTLPNPVLINSIGHAAGLLVFGLIIILLIRDGRNHGIRQARLSLVAAALALGWNLGSLIATGSTTHRPLIVDFVMTASFSTLSFLPAVLFHVTLQHRLQRFVSAAYLVSACAAILHFTELLIPDSGAHQAALSTVVVGFSFLILVAFLLLRRHQPAAPSDWISLACLLLFTASFLHFGYQHGKSPWAAEVTWHHVGIPVVLIVLLQDYRLLLLDTFSRFLINVGLAAVYMASAFAAVRWLGISTNIEQDPFLTGLFLVAACLSLVLFAYLRNTLQAWVSKVVFHRRSADECFKTIINLAAEIKSEDRFLAKAGEEVARHIQTGQFAVVTDVHRTEKLESPSFLFQARARPYSTGTEFSVEAEIPLRFSSGDSRCLMLGARRGGRRYFSEDFEDLRRLGAVIVEQVERLRADELKQLVAQAELRALQAQVNPHFLFNALNTLYGTIDRNSFEARRTVLNLADIFRYYLQGDRELIQLSEELRIVEAYLEIESLRLGGRLVTEVVVSKAARETMIPILSIQPLVENAVKHGIAEKSGSGRVSIRVVKTAEGVHVSVEDTGVGFERSLQLAKTGAGVGLENVRRRLLLCHGPQAELQIESDNNGSVVSFLLPDTLPEGKPLLPHFVPPDSHSVRPSITAEH